MSNISLPNAPNDNIVISGLFAPSINDNIVPGNSNARQASLKIIVQPKPLFRFRYDTEMKTKTSDEEKASSHGSLAQHDDDSNECPPTVRLLNFDGTAIIRCLPYESMKDGKEPKLHQHNLWRKMENGSTKKDLIHIIVNESNNWTATFTGLSIIRTKKNQIKGGIRNKSFNDSRIKKNKNKIRSDQVMLGFDAFEQTNDKTWVKIAGPIFSTQIGDKSKTFIN